MKSRSHLKFISIVLLTGAQILGMSGVVRSAPESELKLPKSTFSSFPIPNPCEFKVRPGKVSSIPQSEVIQIVQSLVRNAKVADRS